MLCDLPLASWPSSATSSPGTSCSRPGGSTSGWSCRPCRTAAGRARWRSPTACTPTWSRRSRGRASSGCGRTRPRRSRRPGRGRRSSPPAPRRASRCASTCRRSTCSAATRGRARCTCTRPRRSPRTSSGRCTRSASRTRARRSTTATRRATSARRSAGASNLVLTNPDMLHLGILPNHGAWGDFLANLAVVVVDEAHVYRGVFGSHVANVLRRLRRVADAYGTEPRVPRRLGDDRQPRRAGRAADRPRAVHGDRPRRLARAPAHDRDVEPADRR